MNSEISLRFNLFPGGKNRALTLSYDDGPDHDRRLVETLNAHGLKGTFHLNSSSLGKAGRVGLDEVRKLFAGHEISAHSVTHPNLEALPPEQLAWEMLEDRRALERLAGYPIRGMSYPFGSHSPEVVAALPHFGIEYARTVSSHNGFNLPTNWLLWHPTCHHKSNITDKLEAFIKTNAWGRPLLYYVWGHSYEFANDNNWEIIERFAEAAGALADQIWFATNIQIYDYQQAVKRLRISADRRLIENPNFQTVWFTVNGQPRELAGGQSIELMD